MAPEDAKEKKLPGYFYNEFTAITFSPALALEAIANAFGEKFVADWDDFEKVSLLRNSELYGMHLRVDLNFNIEPWITAKWFIKGSE